MGLMLRWRLRLVVAFQLVGAVVAQGRIAVDRVTLDAGFEISIYATGIKEARSMARSPAGTIFVGSRREGNLYALVDRDGDQQAEEVYTLGTGMNMPNGVAYHGNSLYVAEVNRVLRYDDIDSRLNDPPEPQVVNDRFPGDRWHGWKYIAFGPDGMLYVPVGAPCNTCEKVDPRYATIMRMNADGSGLEIFSSGVRNTVGFDWHPTTGEPWFTDNGRDWQGENFPPDELNRAPRKGIHFGFPYCHGGYLSDSEFGEKRPCSEFEAPALNLAPHVAALAVHFYRGNLFPSQYLHRLFVVEHGSWNREIPLGYRVMLIELSADGRPVNYRVFAEGWLQGKEAWGRPVDLLELPDGSLLLSDDKANVIYRITYEEPAEAAERSNSP